MIRKLLSSSLTPMTQRVNHTGYLTVAKARAKVLGVVGMVVPIPRPLLLVGENAPKELVDIVVNQGCEKVLIVTDAILNELGVPSRITDALEAKNVDYVVYDGIKPDPTFSIIKEGLQVSIDAGCDSVIAVGGGSVIDAAKLIAMSQAKDCDPEDLMGIALPLTDSLPLYAVPTTAGTGSEATLGAVASDDKTHQKSIAIDTKMVPLVAAIDPVILQGMPPHITAETGIDALTHAIEAWMSAIATDETDYYSASAFKTVLQYLPQAYHNKEDLKSREEMGVAAHYGGIALNRAGLGYTHAIAHQIGALYHIPHGRANAIVLPHILRLNRDVSEERLATLARKIGMDVHDLDSDTKVADYLINQVDALIADLNINTIVPNMDPKDFKAMSKAAAVEVRDKYAVPKYINSKQIVEIITAIMTDSNAKLDAVSKDNDKEDKNSHKSNGQVA